MKKKMEINKLMQEMCARDGSVLFDAIITNIATHKQNWSAVKSSRYDAKLKYIVHIVI